MPKSKIEGCRALHWVLKISNLRRSLEFFENVLGLRVLRHEEFTSGCDATCNGPYGGAWSKTMIGYGSELSNFALELTYNYGIDSYTFGNDLLFIALECPAALVRAKALGYTVIESESIILGPDNYRFKILPNVKGRSEQFRYVALRVANLQNAIDYWVKTLGLLVSDAYGLQISQNTPASIVSFPGSNQVGLLLVQSEHGVGVDHALSSGRIAFACPTSSVPFIFDLVTTAGERVQTPPLTLLTPGKADVVVTILLDRDDYEICFVEDAAFYDLATPLYDIVDFQDRASRGGDGAVLPTAPPLHTVGTVGIESIEQFRSLTSNISQPGRTILIEFGASWCKKCRALAPLITKKVQEYHSLLVCTVDIDELADLSIELDIKAVPRFQIYRAGKLVEDFTGSSEADIEVLFMRAISYLVEI